MQMPADAVAIADDFAWERGNGAAATILAKSMPRH